MEQLDYMLHREEYEKDVYERQQAYRKLEARWPKWIKYSSWAIWGVFLLLGFLFHSSAMGLMLGFVIGGGISADATYMAHLVKAYENAFATLPFQAPHAEVVAARFRNDANLLGAVVHYGTASR